MTGLVQRLTEDGCELVAPGEPSERPMIMRAHAQARRSRARTRIVRARAWGTGSLLRHNWIRRAGVARSSLDWLLLRPRHGDWTKMRLVYPRIGKELVDSLIAGLDEAVSPNEVVGPIAEVQHFNIFDGIHFTSGVGDRDASLADCEGVVLPGPIKEQIVPSGIPVDGVVPLTSHEDIPAITSPEKVIAGITHENVITSCTIELVVTITTG